MRSFTYSDAGRMVTVTMSGITTTYSYNALGQRVKKGSSAGTAYFIYDEAGHLIGEYTAGGTLVQELVWMGDIPVATIRTDQGGSGVGVFYIHTDHLNAPTKITRAADNQIIWRWDHDPFGNGAPNEDPDGNGLLLVFNLRFPGQYFDQETGLHYNYARNYDPAVGGYTTSDPIGMRGGVNTYSYVLNNPISYIDPYGLDVQICRQPAFGWMPIDHQWIKTDTVEAGMGGNRGHEAGNESGDRPGDPVYVMDHAGRSKQKGSSCEKVDNVDEKKVNDLLKIGRPIGKWGPFNQCQSFVEKVIKDSSVVPREPPAPAWWNTIPTI
jgi:RHS repeat-associated protein